MLSIDDLTVDSFTTAAEGAVVGEQDTGCIGPCEDRFSEGYC